MKRHSRTAGVAVAFASAIATSSCVTAPQEAQPAPVSVPAHQYRLAQVQRNGSTTFAACTDCPRPTPKTVARLAGTTAPAGMTPSPVGVRPPQKAAPAAERQATATVLFDLNSARITPQIQQRIEALAPLLRQASRIHVTAYTDALGDLALNSRLADTRALAIVLAIRERLDAERGAILSGTGRPLCCYVADNKSAETRQPNRRAEVTLTLPASAEVEALLQALAKSAALRGAMVFADGQQTPALAAVGAGGATTKPVKNDSEVQ